METSLDKETELRKRRSKKQDYTAERDITDEVVSTHAYHRREGNRFQSLIEDSNDDSPEGLAEANISDLDEDELEDLLKIVSPKEDNSEHSPTIEDTSDRGTRKKNNKMPFWKKRSSRARKANAEDPPALPLPTGATLEASGGGTTGGNPETNPREDSKPCSALPKSCSRTTFAKMLAKPKKIFPSKKKAKADNLTLPVSLADSQTQTEVAVDEQNDVKDCSQIIPAESPVAASTTADDYVDFIEDDGHMCAICYEIMARPHALRPCGHVFCEVCLRQLQAMTARGRGSARYGGGFVLVLCPVCRAPIAKSEPQEELDATIQSKYPQKYMERKKVLTDERSKNKQSRLPSYTGSFPPNPKLFRRGRVPPPARLAQQQAQRPARLRVWLSCGKSLAWGATIGALFILVSTYWAFFVTTVGLWKFCLRMVGLHGRVCRPERQQGPLGIKSLRSVSLAMFVVSLKLWMTLPWAPVLALNVIVSGIAYTGYYLDHPNVSKTIFRVIPFAMI